MAKCLKCGCNINVKPPADMPWMVNHMVCGKCAAKALRGE